MTYLVVRVIGYVLRVLRHISIEILEALENLACLRFYHGPSSQVAPW